MLLWNARFFFLHGNSRLCVKKNPNMFFFGHAFASRAALGPELARAFFGSRKVSAGRLEAGGGQYFPTQKLGNSQKSVRIGTRLRMAGDAPRLNSRKAVGRWGPCLAASLQKNWAGRGPAWHGWPIACVEEGGGSGMKWYASG